MLGDDDDDDKDDVTMRSRKWMEVEWMMGYIYIYDEMNVMFDLFYHDIPLRLQWQLSKSYHFCSSATQYKSLYDCLYTSFVLKSNQQDECRFTLINRAEFNVIKTQTHMYIYMYI